MNPEIDQYLQKKEKDFNEGFALFCRYSRNESLMSWIGRKKDEARLVYELGKLSRLGACTENPLADRHLSVYNKSAASANHGSKAPATASDIIFRTYDERKTRRADLPERLQKVYDDIAGDYKLRRSYHEKMKTAMTDKDRAELSRLWRCDTTFAPAMDSGSREKLLADWHRAVGRSRGWIC